MTHRAQNGELLRQRQTNCAGRSIGEAQAEKAAHHIGRHVGHDQAVNGHLALVGRERDQEAKGVNCAEDFGRGTSWICMAARVAAILGERAIAIVQQVRWGLLVGEGVAVLLHRPGGGRVFGNRDIHDASNDSLPSASRQ